MNVEQQERVRRAQHERGWDALELERREKHQIALDNKRASSDYVVDNNSDINALRHQAKRIYQQITS